jgi:zinc transporter ZupT
MSATTGSLIIALCWIVPFAVGGRVRLGSTRFSRRLLSAAGGSAIAYVFIDLLPEMQHMQQRFLAAAEGRAFPFPHYRVYTSALAGFLLFYVLEHAAAASRPGETHGERPPAERPTVLWLQIAGFAVYVGMMAYLLREDAESRALAMLPYGVAMFLHFWIVDHALRHEHGAPYARSGRWLLAGGVVGGWLLAAMEVGSELWLPTLMGFIAGGIVLNSVKGEMPEEGQARMVPFVGGALGYALLLLMAN